MRPVPDGYTVQTLPFREVWAVDFEFNGPEGGIPRPVCMVARELKAGRVVRLWREDLARCLAAPFDIGPDSLVMAYYASAEVTCFLSCGWPLPVNLLDLFTEHRAHINGRGLPFGNSLVDALQMRGLSSIGAERKDAMRKKVMQQDSWSATEQADILDYCEGDTTALERLLSHMCPAIELRHALLRGRYMKSAGCIEQAGIPIDMPGLTRLRRNWTGIKDVLIGEVDEAYGVYTNGSFDSARFEAWICDHDIPWPRYGKFDALKLDGETIKQQARSFPILNDLHELRSTLSTLRANKLQIGPDGRNRTLLSAFRSVTGRNQPSNSKFIFGPARWMRGYIKPAKGFGLAYIDYEQQEIAIGAALSGDRWLTDAYASGDVYVAFGRDIGLIPPDGTAATHGHIREVCKIILLGIGYGMSGHGLATRLGLDPLEGERLLRRHRKAYPRFWECSDQAIVDAAYNDYLISTFGWRRWITDADKVNSLRNWHAQANGAEMLRLACIACTEAGIRVIAPVHDALLIEAPLERLPHDITLARYLMERASVAVTGGLIVRTDYRQVTSPRRYMDKRGVAMWRRVGALISQRDLQPMRVV